MKFLFFQWNALMQQDLEQVLTSHHCSFRRFSYTFGNDAYNDFFVERFGTHLKNHTYDAVISFNFFPLVSDVCEKYQIPYIAWCYDSPVRLSSTDSLRNSCNTVLMFDKKEALSYQSKGFDRVFHLPLAVNTKRLNTLFNGKNWDYDCDVSFLGNLHHGNLQDFINPLPEYEKGYLNGLITLQRSLSGTFILDTISVPALLNRLNPYYKCYTNDPNFSLSENDFTFLFGKYVTEQERIYLLKEISTFCKMDVYSNQPDSIPSTCNYIGSADYFTQMPFVFRQSKINLNPTFHCIRSGISLRALDIMGSGGFLLCNAQEEMFEHFTPYEDFAFYNSIEEVPDMVRFYLDHNSLREQMAYHGWLQIQNMFSYDIQFPKILQMAGLL